FTVKLLGLLDATQLHQSLPSRLRRSHARAQVVFDVHRQMTLHLGFEIEVVALAGEHRGESREEAQKHSHESKSFRQDPTHSEERRLDRRASLGGPANSWRQERPRQATPRRWRT